MNLMKKKLIKISELLYKCIGYMKKFLISTILTFIGLFIVVSCVSYYFYERIVEAY